MALAAYVTYHVWSASEAIRIVEPESSYVSDSMMISASSINTLSLYKSLTLVF